MILPYRSCFPRVGGGFDSSAVFPDIDFILPGQRVGSLGHGAVSEDEWGRYALLKGVAPDNSASSPYDQTLSAFENLERELEDVVQLFYCPGQKKVITGTLPDPIYFQRTFHYDPYRKAVGIFQLPCSAFDRQLFC